MEVSAARHAGYAALIFLALLANFVTQMEMIILLALCVWLSYLMDRQPRTQHYRLEYARCFISDFLFKTGLLLFLFVIFSLAWTGFQMIAEKL